MTSFLLQKCGSTYFKELHIHFNTYMNQTRPVSLSPRNEIKRGNFVSYYSYDANMVKYT